MRLCVLTIYDGTWSNTRSASSYANVYTYTGRQLDTETGLFYYRARFLHAQLGRFTSRDPIGYEGGVDPYEYVSSCPVIAVDPHGLELIVLPEQVTDIPITEAGNLPEFGTTTVAYRWVTARQTPAVLFSVPVPCSICESLELSVASWTIDRVSSGTIQIHRFNIVVPGDNPDPKLVALANEINRQTQWEENAHKNAALRWLRDHRETGYGTGCSRAAALIMAKRVAEARVRVVEAMLSAGFAAENALIDSLGQIQLQMLIQQIMGGN